MSEVTSHTSFFSPTDMQQSSIVFGAMCGHGAFAAAIGSNVFEVMKHFQRGGWVNMPIMEKALRNARKSPKRVNGWWTKDDDVALTLLQFLGPWMAEGVSPFARCRYRHWVATRGNLIWDANTEAWHPKEVWEDLVIRDLMPERGTGYEAFRSLIWG